jgi:hypothetical protein
MARRQARSKPFLETGIGKAIGVVFLVILALVAYNIYENGINLNFDSGDGGGTTPQIVQPTGSYLWDARGSTEIKAPDVNLTIEDARFSSTEGATNPTTDNIYVYWFTENPLTLTPADTYYSNYDRLEYLVSDGRFIFGTSAVDWGSTSQEVLDTAILTAIAKSPTSYNETDGKLYMLLLDNDYVEGTPSTAINGWPVVLEIDMNTIPAYSVQATAPVHFLNFGKTMSDIKQVWPVDAGGASGAWNTKTAGWPEMGTGTCTVGAGGSSDLNSTADNYQGATIALATGGVFFWEDCELVVRIDANSASQSFNKFTIDNERINDVKTEQIGGITYYFVKVPRDKATGGTSFAIRAYYDQTETTTTVDYMPTIMEWNSLGAQMATSANARIYDLDTTSITSSVYCP